MKAYRITTRANGTFEASPLPLPTVHRKGSIEAELYRQQASGAAPPTKHVLHASDAVRAIRFSDGPVARLESGPGPHLTFVIAGELRFNLGADEMLALVPGDILLTDGGDRTGLEGFASDGCRLVQLDVAPDWPGPDAAIQEPGTIVPRPANAPNFKRISTGKDEHAYFSELGEIFPTAPDLWSEPRPIRGFRLLCWEDGWMDYHPGVINQLAVILSGEMEIEVRGGGGASETFYAGDLCIAEDRTGEGHIDRVRGVAHIAMLVIDTEHLWGAADGGSDKLMVDR